MWPNNGFGNNMPFTNNFNQEDFTPPSPFGNGPGTPLQGQNMFPLPNMNPFEDPNGEGFMTDFRPEVGLFNEGTYIQNQGQFMSPQFPIPQFHLHQTPTNTNGGRPATQINARAAELKAQLLKGREARSGSFTPPVPAGLASKSGNSKPMKEATSSGSLKTSITAAENREQDLNALISEFSVPRPVLDSASKPQVHSDTKQIVSSPEPISVASIVKPSQTSLLDSSAKVIKPVSVDTKMGEDSTIKPNGNDNVAIGSASDMSEGEILDEPTPPTSQPVPEAKKSHLRSSPSNHDHQTARVSKVTPSKQPLRRDSRDESPRREPPSQPRSQSYRSYDERRDSLRQDRRQHESDYKADRKSLDEYKHDALRRRPSRDGYRKHEMEKEVSRRSSRDEEHRQYEGERGRRSSRDVESSRREESTHAGIKVQVPKTSIRETNPPTLAELVPHDADLREWLEITGYHNTSYRDKILDRRRKLAILDAQRIKLLAEIETDERAGIPPTSSHQPLSSMLPPPAPSKTEESKTEEKQDTEMISPSTSDPPRSSRMISNKRSYSDSEESFERGATSKIARIDDRMQLVKIKEEEEDIENRRPRSSGLGSSRRSSVEHGQDSSRLRYDDDRNTSGRGSSREREFSPGRRAYEGRPARSRHYDSDENEKDDRSERSFSGRGGYGYHGPPQNYDPNYRGRGRGRSRGRGGGRGAGFEEAKSEQPALGSKIATSKPFRDSRGFDRGGKAGS